MRRRQLDPVPRFSAWMNRTAMQICDAHTHLQDERLADRLPAIMRRAAAAGVGMIVCCGTSPGDWAGVGRAARCHPEVIAAFGVHPWFVDAAGEGWFDELCRRAAADPGSCIGEIGLDRALEKRDDRLQTAVFRRQVVLARELGRPFCVHCRQAWGELMDALTELGPFTAGFMVHSYSGAADLVGPLARLGGYFSYSGSITRPSNRRARTSLAAVPLERLLIETDTPDMLPLMAESANAAGELNEPANVGYVLRTVAELRGLSVEQCAELTWTNAGRLFRGTGGTED